MKINRLVRQMLLMLGSLLLAAVAPAAADPLFQQEQVAGTQDQAISVHLPPGWVFQSMPANESYSSTLLFAQDQTVLDTVVRAYYAPVATAPGSYGIVTILNPKIWTVFNPDPQKAIFFYLDQLTKFPTNPLTVNNAYQVNIGDLYNAAFYDVTSPTLNSRAYLGGFVAGDKVVFVQLAVVPTASFEGAAPLLQAIAQTIRIPSEQGALVAPALLTPTLPQLQSLPTLPAVTAPAILPTQPAPTAPPLLPSQPTIAPVAPTVSAPQPPVLVRSSDGQLSLELPADWTFLDQAEDQNVVAFGDSIYAAQSRLDTIIPRLDGSSAEMLIGNGGVIALYRMATFGIDPDAPNLEPLMQRVIDNLLGKGYQRLSAVTPITIGGVEGLQVIVSGGEEGYLVLAPFGAQVAYISGTTMPGGIADNPAMAARLLAIVQSVRVPAAEAEEVVPPTPASGFGGLEDLQGTALFSSPTPTAPIGVGGLGDLEAPAAPTATASRGRSRGVGAPAATAEAG